VQPGLVECLIDDAARSSVLLGTGGGGDLVRALVRGGLHAGGLGALLGTGGPVLHAGHGEPRGGLTDGGEHGERLQQLATRLAEGVIVLWRADHVVSPVPTGYRPRSGDSSLVDGSATGWTIGGRTAG